MKGLVAASVSLLLGARPALGDCPTGCPSRCPDQLDVQSPFVKEHFNISKFWGVFYEIAFHDSTQPSYWFLKAGCQRSVKSQHPGDPRNYKDLFSLHVGPFGGVNAVCDLEFNVTDRPGVFLGHWSGDSVWNPNLQNINNTVVDVGVAPNGTYEWSLEFQCRDDDDPKKGIRFAAVNFYHKKPLIDASEFEEMKSRLRARGLGWLMDTKPGLSMVDQKTCVEKNNYPAFDSKPSWCGQRSQARAAALVV